jgi:hypothetical protein
VDHGIAGAWTGEKLTIHEWAGAASISRPMHSGQKMLFLFYRRSRLGLTSPVGGAAGQLELDASGKNVIVPSPTAKELRNASLGKLSEHAVVSPTTVSVALVERAIRAARNNARPFVPTMPAKTVASARAKE